MSFLPEEDQEFLDTNGIKHELLTEKRPMVMSVTLFFSLNLHSRAIYEEQKGTHL